MGREEPDLPPSADLGSRLLATVVDGVVQLLLVIPFSATLLVITMATAPSQVGTIGPGASVAVVVAFIATPFAVVGYHVWLEGRYAETIGKHLLGLRVVDTRGGPINWRHAVLRNAVRPLDALPVAYLLGGVVAIIDEDGRRLGDVAAGTRVVHRDDIRPGASQGPHQGPVPVLEE